MFKNFMNCSVVVIVSTRAETMLEYTGTLSYEDDSSIRLNNVSINAAMLSFQKNIFGDNMSVYRQGIDEVIINKNYIISCSRDNA